MFGDFEEKFNPLDVKPKEEPPDTVVTPCQVSDASQNCSNEEIINESIQPLKLSDEHNFNLKTEIKIKNFDDYTRQETSLSSGEDYGALKTNQCKKQAVVFLTRLSETTIAKYVTQEMCNDISVDMTVESSYIEKQEWVDNWDDNIDPLSLSMEDENAQYDCDMCEKRYKHKSHLNRHIKSTHENVRYNCDQCDKSYSTKTDLRCHIQIVHEKVRYKCEECDLSLINKRNLYVHVKAVHQKFRYNCDKCEKTFSTQEYLKTHIKSAHEKVRYNCEFCDKIFSLKTSLKKHVKSAHENIRYNCDKCDIKFSLKSTLNQHIQKIHENIPFRNVCDICEESFATKQYLINHIRRVRYNCEKCDKNFAWKRDLNVHTECSI